MTQTISLKSLEQSLDALLEPSLYSDYAPNGLQVEGRGQVSHIVVGVSANQTLIDRAIALEADAIIVHHGFFWKGEPDALRGWKGRRIGALMRNDLSLFGYHLPLDAHAELGNNVQVLKAIDATPSAQFGGGRTPLGWLGQLAQPTPRAEMIARLETTVGPVGTAFLHGPELITRVGVVTGGGASFFEAALEEHADLFVTGEPSEQSQGYAVELGGNFVAAGHHATERFGPRALGDYLSNTFSLAVTFVDVANPV